MHVYTDFLSNNKAHFPAFYASNSLGYSLLNKIVASIIVKEKYLYQMSIYSLYYSITIGKLYIVVPNTMVISTRH